MASTLILTNTDALSRMADSILDRGPKPSKQAILNAAAHAIAGPGHDWGFLKKAPEGRFSQPGLSWPEASPENLQAPQSSNFLGWIATLECLDNMGKEPMIFPTREDALRGVIAHGWHEDEDYPEDLCIRILEKTGELNLPLIQSDIPEDEDPEFIDSLNLAESRFEYDYGYKIKVRPIGMQPSSPPELPQSEQATTKRWFVCDTPSGHSFSGWDSPEMHIYDDLEDAIIKAEMDGYVYDLALCQIKASAVRAREHCGNVEPIDSVDFEWVIPTGELPEILSAMSDLGDLPSAPSEVRHWDGILDISLSIVPYSQATPARQPALSDR